jgi:cyclophilin family peptidyl-prolyl cis-trans isomerase
VDKGFVAQVADVIGGRQGKLNKVQQVEAEKEVPLEVKADVKHTEGASRTPQPVRETRTVCAHTQQSWPGGAKSAACTSASCHVLLYPRKERSSRETSVRMALAVADAQHGIGADRHVLVLLMCAGVLSMGRYDDPNSGSSSFSFLLGAAPHLDMKYTIFG